MEFLFYRTTCVFDSSIQFARYKILHMEFRSRVLEVVRLNVADKAQTACSACTEAKRLLARAWGIRSTYSSFFPLVLRTTSVLMKASVACFLVSNGRAARALSSSMLKVPPFWLSSAL